VRADKHSTGGVGDKTTLVVAPVLAAIGVPVLKVTGRALGHTGGTADKLEAIPGVRTSLSIEKACAQVQAIGLAVMCQSARMVPADKRMYATRDATGTIASLPLIASSIITKKLASGADVVVLDVKVGSGTFVADLDEAHRLADLMVRVARGCGVCATALLTDMDQPLGRSVGNALEVEEACGALTDPAHADGRFMTLCRELCSRAAQLALGVQPNDADLMAARAIEAGDGAAKLSALIRAQGGDPAVVEHPEQLPHASCEGAARAQMKGIVTSVHAGVVGSVARSLGADPGAGIRLHAAPGDAVSSGDRMATVFASTESAAQEAALQVARAFVVGDRTPRNVALIMGSVP
jgi:pyrimidine-nucleoside phosphorylase